MNERRLKLSASGDREIVMTRVFDAPRHLVWRALTTPALLERWLLGPEGWTMSVPTFDLRVGGEYRYVWRRERDGQTMGAGGAFRAIESPVLLVQTERFDDPWYPGEAVITTELVEREGGTTFTATMQYESREARDGVLASPMESGVSKSYDRLAEVIASLQ